LPAWKEEVMARQASSKAPSIVNFTCYAVAPPGQRRRDKKSSITALSKSGGGA